MPQEETPFRGPAGQVCSADLLSSAPARISEVQLQRKFYQALVCEMDLNNARLPPQLDLAYSEGHEDSDNESVTDEDIQQLLQDAAQRLRENANAEKSMTVGKVVVPKLPTVGAYDVANIYVRTEGDIAHADPGRLLDKSSRELSNKVRKVEDPIIVKQRKLEVCVRRVSQLFCDPS